MKISTFGFLTRRGVRNLGKHWAMTIACIASLSVCMTLNTFASLAEVNVDSMVNYLGNQNETVVYLDPRSTGIGQVLTFAAAYANGGSVDNVQPGTDYLGKLHAAGNVLRVEGTTPYAKFLKGEIPVWISYENDGLKAKHVDGMGDAVEVVIPKEASVAAPYAISLVKNGPNPNAGKLWLNFIMSEAGQSLFAQGFVRPAVPGTPLAADVAAKMPAAPQIRPLDVVKASERKAEVDRLWAQAALGNK